VLQAADLRFDMIWRSGAGEHVVVSFTHHYDPPTSGYNAVPFDGDADGAAVPAAAGDQLVMRMTVTNASSSAPAFIPNADGPHTSGRIPSITLPVSGH
jgi:hypothetical protein